MKKYRSYNGDKPYIFATCSEHDEHYCETILDKLIPVGYRVRIENKGAVSTATLQDLEKARVVFFVLTERFVSDAQCYKLLQKAEESRKPLLIYAPEDTSSLKELMMRLIKTPDTSVIIRPGEEELTASKTVNALLDATLGLTPTLAMKVFRRGVRMVENDGNGDGMSFIRLAAGENCAEAILWLGKRALESARVGNGEYETAVEHLFGAARLGNTEAMFLLGKMLKDGEGFECDHQLAYTYILKSAQHGFPPAQTELAEMYDHGIGTEPDKTLATKWYITAADKGEKGAYLPLAIRYLDGVYIEKDEELAERYLVRSSAGGNADADLILAKLYKEATASGESSERSEGHFKKAAEAGICEAQYFYALTLLTSKKLRRRERNRLAFYWMKRAADDRIDGTEGSPDAMYQLGLFYQKGRGCKRDLQKAFISFYSAATLGHAGALAAVSECYKKGIGVSVNKKAAALFKKRALKAQSCS